MMAADPAAVGPATESFDVHGMRNGSVVRITWDRGVLAGDPPTIDLVEIEAECIAVSSRDPLVVRAGEPIVAGAGAGAGAGADGASLLSQPESALAVMRRVVDRVTEVVVPARHRPSR
jgi:hypothetical protein